MRIYTRTRAAAAPRLYPNRVRVPIKRTKRYGARVASGVPARPRFSPSCRVACVARTFRTVEAAAATGGQPVTVGRPRDGGATTAAANDAAVALMCFYFFIFSVGSGASR